MSSSTKSIAVITGSTRKPRAGPQITDFVVNMIKASPSFQSASAVTLTTIDLAAWNLPLFDEPTVPSQIHAATDYGQPHTQKWSAEISRHDAFAFVTPQYNWGYPAALKNAIDYLFNEWKGKPAVIVSYGGHGGGKAAAQLRQVLDGVGMTVAETMPALMFAGRPMVVLAARGGDLKLLPPATVDELEFKGVWDEYGDVIRKAFDELLRLLA